MDTSRDAIEAVTDVRLCWVRRWALVGHRRSDQWPFRADFVAKVFLGC